MLPTGIIIAAAGESKRLGQPKQLLPFQGGTLLRHAAKTALAARLGPVVVVLGAVESGCRAALEGLAVTVAVNARWPEGVGSSIACGMATLREVDLEAVMVMLCDQPAVSVGVLTRIVEEQRRTGAKVVASSYADTVGPPALFTRSWFPRLLELHGRSGAKALFKECPGMVMVPFPGGEMDIDEPAHLRYLDGSHRARKGEAVT